MECARTAAGIAEHVISSAQVLCGRMMRSFPHCCCLGESDALKWARMVPVAGKSD